MKLEPEPGLSRELVELYRTDAAHQSDVDRAYRRFLRRTEGRGLLPRAGRWLIGGLVLGLGVSYAASRAPWNSPTGPAPESVVISTNESPNRPSLAARFSAPAGPTAGPGERAVSHGPGKAAAFSSPPQTRPKAAPPAQYSAPSTPAMSAAPPVAHGAFDLPERSTAEWSKVANALREKDVRTAEVELQQLERSTKLEEREAARLARAQILVGSGRTREAGALLQGLVTRAQSPLVRARAAALMREITKAP